MIVVRLLLRAQILKLDNLAVLIGDLLSLLLSHLFKLISDLLEASVLLLLPLKLLFEQVVVLLKTTYNLFFAIHFGNDHTKVAELNLLLSEAVCLEFLGDHSALDRRSAALYRRSALNR